MGSRRQQYEHAGGEMAVGHRPHERLDFRKKIGAPYTMVTCRTDARLQHTVGRPASTHVLRTDEWANGSARMRYIIHGHALHLLCMFDRQHPRLFHTSSPRLGSLSRRDVRLHLHVYDAAAGDNFRAPLSLPY